jgi:hypothetical protein
MEQNWEKLYGLCSCCEQPKSYYDWCPSCDNQYLDKKFSDWTSGNEEIDELIRDTQRNATSYTSYLEWIPWEKLTNLKMFNGFTYCTMYEAEWTEGERITNYFKMMKLIQRTQCAHSRICRRGY